MDLMYEYICESSCAMRHIQENAGKIFADFNARTRGSNFNEIILLGSGTSYNASLTAYDFLEYILGVSIKVYYPLWFVDHVRTIDPHSLVVGVSQAGRSSSTIEAINKAKKFGMTTVALTAGETSPLKNASDIFVKLDIGEENVGPKTKGYFGSVVELIYLGLYLAKAQDILGDIDFARYESELLNTTDSIKNIAESFNDWYGHNKEDLKTAKRVIVIGYDNNLGAMSEGSLKLLEALRCSVSCYELEEFMHGAYHSIDKNTYILALGNPSRHKERLLRLMKYLKTHKQAKVFLISDEESEFKTFVYPFNNNEYFISLEYIVALQVLARKLSLDQGIDCCVSADPDFHKIMESYKY